jgi:hypothetical protein
MKVYMEFPEIMNQLLKHGEKVLKKATVIKKSVEDKLNEKYVFFSLNILLGNKICKHL